jgi:hypothetical protein
MAIFDAACFIFLFFFLEETNYERPTVGVIYAEGSQEGVGEKTAPSAAAAASNKDEEATSSWVNNDGGNGNIVLQGSEKTYWQKLSLLDKSRPFTMHKRAWQILRLIAWPVVFYSGFSYGTYLIWFNILNATSSIVLGGAPYNFQPSIVGLSYLACIVGVIIG